MSHLLESVVRIADSTPELAARRLAILNVLKELTGALAGNWSWGHSDGQGNVPSPLAFIDLGFNESQKAAFVKVGVGPEIDREFRMPIQKLMNGRRQRTTLRQDLFDDNQWKASFMGQHLTDSSMDSWVHCVRFSQVGVWSNLMLFRKIGEPPFQESDRLIVDAAMSSIPWLHATETETLPAQSIVGLTSRQRAVLLMLMDGQSRKQIARLLGIAEETVGDHLKHIYRHFDVNSSGELAALFLRGK